MKNKNFSRQVLTWFDDYGRKDLPWQHDLDPYKIWVSEIMLQQTRVETVIPYYDKFIRRFQTIKELANASIDEVLHHWTGLGYYARARNLHKAANLICNHHESKFPKDIEAVMALPGIGRSTAGAILALSFDQPHAILDGNVKRVLTRYFAIEGWPGERAIELLLWAKAESLLPNQRIAHYTQAMMDIGATVCTRTNPKCLHCPLLTDCKALTQQRQHELPTAKPSCNLPEREIHMAILQDRNGAVWLEKRPPVGIWGGLYSFPEFENFSSMQRWLQKRCNSKQIEYGDLPTIRHTFTHFHLQMHPKLIQLQNKPKGILEDDVGVWYKFSDQKIGLASPVKKTLQQLIQA